MEEQKSSQRSESGQLPQSQKDAPSAAGSLGLSGALSRRITLLWSVLAVALLVLLDQLTKTAAAGALRQKPPIVLLSGVLELRYLENRGAAFGMFQNGQLFFSAVAIVAAILIFLFLYRLPRTRRYLPLRICLLLVAAGALGNLLDRVTLHYVRDFIYFSLINFPIFNVADMYVTVATALLVVLLLFYYNRDDDFAFLQRKSRK